MASTLPMNGGTFYTDSLTEVMVDPAVPNPTPQTQSKLQVELKRYEALAQRDFRYSHLVAGASKMPMASIWVARNQDETVSDVDLATFRDLAWGEFVKKRFLAKVSPDTSVASAATSMLEIVRDMNLQRRRFHIMGLHEQVEASELQLVMHLCQANILRGYGNDFKRAALRLRRSDQVYEAFAMAVGAFVCATAPMTLGAGTGRYERDLQFEYKKQMVALLVYALQQNPRAMEVEEGLDDDYVARIARLIVVWQGRGGDDTQMVGDSKDDGGDSSSNKEAVKQQFIGLNSAVALAQHDAQEAKDGMKKTEALVKEFQRQRATELQNGRAELLAEYTRLVGGVDARINEQSTLLAAAIDAMKNDINSQGALHDADMARHTAEMRDYTANLRTDMFDMLRNFFTTGADGQQTAAQKLVVDSMTAYTQQLTANIPTMVQGIVDGMQLQARVDAIIQGHLSTLNAHIDAQAQAALGQAGLGATIDAAIQAHLLDPAMTRIINAHLDAAVGNRLTAIEQRIVDSEGENKRAIDAIRDSGNGVLTTIGQQQAQLDALVGALTGFGATLDVIDNTMAALGNMSLVLNRLKADYDDFNTDMYRLKRNWITDHADFENYKKEVDRFRNKLGAIERMYGGRMDTDTQSMDARFKALEDGFKADFQTISQSIGDMNIKIAQRGGGGAADLDAKLRDMRRDLQHDFDDKLGRLDAKIAKDWTRKG